MVPNGFAQGSRVVIVWGFIVFFGRRSNPDRRAVWTVAKSECETTFRAVFVASQKEKGIKDDIVYRAATYSDAQVGGTGEKEESGRKRSWSQATVDKSVGNRLVCYLAPGAARREGAVGFLFAGRTSEQPEPGRRQEARRGSKRWAKGSLGN